VRRLSLLIPLAVIALAVGPVSSAQEPPPAGSATVPPLLVPDGVTIAGIAVGGLTVDEARLLVETQFARPLDIVHGGIHWFPTPERLGARPRLDAALSAAVIAPPGSAIDLLVQIRGADVRAFIADVERRLYRAPKDSRLKLVKLRPRITDPVIGKEVDRAKFAAAIVQALHAHSRGPLSVAINYLKPKTTKASYGPIVVIRRETKRLFLYKGEEKWKVFRIATGQSSYPTPLGNFRVVDKQRNPWWYPPKSTWAAGASPVPPGPGNPLGTRWMGLSAPLIGIHGTPDASSIGYSASHGCIRMLVSQAEWLFDRVRVGTPVFIVRA
jgi:lipoprotein-anchoring transpeptidase ErfK/SrfK